MKKISKKIVFFGTDNFSLATLKLLIDNGYDVSAVVTKPDSKSGRGQKINTPSVKKYAIENNIEVWQPDKISDLADKIKKLGDETMGILVSFGKIIPESIINLFSPGIINIHPSLLPKYRGPTPIESAIANGDSETGASIILLTSAMDAGPIYSQTKYKLSGNENQPELYEKLAQLGAKQLIDNLPDIINNNLKAIPQDNPQSSYCAKLNKQDALLDLSNTTAIAAERLIRAHLDFPKTKLKVLDEIVIITKAHVSEQEQSPIDILCIDHKYLAIDELVAPSGKRMNAKAFINGYSG
jgi:methionyl-tRNA formyltransferase